MIFAGGRGFCQKFLHYDISFRSALSVKIIFIRLEHGIGVVFMQHFIDCINQHIFHFNKDYILGNLVIDEIIHLNQFPHLKANKEIGLCYVLFK